jgi:hypothetical protein
MNRTMNCALELMEVVEEVRKLAEERMEVRPSEEELGEFSVEKGQVFCL